MADPLSTASALLTLVVFAFQSSTALYQVIDSFQTTRRSIRELQGELETLNEVLNSLRETVANTDTDLTALKLPLLRCGKACKDFEAVIVKCTAHSGGARTSFRDWAKLQYMGDNIDGFKDMLAGYKSTITIALGDANIRTAAVTAKVLEEYKVLIKNTTSDLEERLEAIDKKLQALSSQSTAVSGEEATDIQQIQEERDCTQQCLSICAKVYAHVDQIQTNSLGNISTPPGAHHVPATTLEDSISARVVTTNTLKECQRKLTNTTSQLEKHLQDIDLRLRNLSSQRSSAPNKQTAEQEQIKEELASIKECLTICNQASEQANQHRTHVFEDVLMVDDGYQVIVATFGDLLSAKRITAGSRSKQWLGQMSDDTLQQLSRDSHHTAVETDTEPQARVGAQFENRHGTGYKLSSGSLKGKGTSHP